MDNLVVEDALNVFDRGYVDYKKFDNYCAKGIRFVTRLKGNAKIEVVKELPVDPTSPIKKHQIAYLGTKGINRMKHPLRLIETEDTKCNPIIIITNNFGLSTAEISDVYRYCWRIEIFFQMDKTTPPRKTLLWNKPAGCEKPVVYSADYLLLVDVAQAENRV